MKSAAASTRTSCPYCGVGCGVITTPSANGTIEISGDKEHPANRGKLCSKGSDLAEVLKTDDRLLTPQINNTRVSWDNALDYIAESFKNLIEEHGSEAIAFYVSGQLLTEDYYVVNKFVKGYLGHANIDTNSRLCMASSVAGHRRAFGSDTVPGCYEDLDQAELIILCGSNLAWCHPVLFQRIVATKAARPSLQVVVIDPRRTASCELTDIHLPINSDTDATLFNGLLNYLSDTDCLDHDYINTYTQDINDALATANSNTIPNVSSQTQLSAEAVTKFYELFAKTEKVVTIYSQGVNQSQTGTDTVNSIINCHFATGRIGQPGMGPFSITGQPNAMGGREVGGLANMLAAHMDIDNKAHQQLVQRFWDSPTIADKQGLKAVDLFDAIDDGKIKAIWIMATNPVDSMPEADAIRAALKKCPLVIVSDVVTQTDTLDLAHVKLPACAWGEKDGTVTNSERRITRQRAFRPATGESRPDWWAVCQVAKRMGFGDDFNYSSSADIFREHAALSGYNNNGSRDFNISKCSAITNAEYHDLIPFQWPYREGTPPANSRFFANGGFFTGNGLGRFIPITPQRKQTTANAETVTLNTGRIRDQWHTMTRTGTSARLSAHMAEPYAEINPYDAQLQSINDAELINVSSKKGSIIVRALITPNQQRGSIFIPMHWTDQHSANSRVNTLITAVTDPYSGQPASKSESVVVTRYIAAHYGFAVATEKALIKQIIQCIKRQTADNAYWALAPCSTGWRLEFASEKPAAAVQKQWQQQVTDDCEVISSADTSANNYHTALFKNESLIAAVFISRQPVSASRHWATEQLGKPFDYTNRIRVLAARPANDQADIGAIVCSCFMVGKNEIISAAQNQQCGTVDQIGAALNAGTNCGSCRGEISRIIKETAKESIAEIS